MPSHNKIIAVELDASTGSNLPPELVDEQNRAIADLLVKNDFRPVLDPAPADNSASLGPYKINLKSRDQKLIIEINNNENNLTSVAISLKPFQRLMKDYAMVCDSYYKAVRQASPHKIEALDMGRRGLHDEGATILQDNLEGKIECDFATARRLFTLMYILFVPSLR